MATTPKKITTTSAVRKLELSRVSPVAVARETMGEDLDIMKFVLYLASKVRVDDMVERVTGANISRSVEASSLLTVNVNDYDRALLNSGLLYNKLDVQIDGLWFRLAGVDFESTIDELVLSFEDREIAVLRGYSSWKIARRNKVTRAQFILNLIREVKEVDIPVVIPELRIVQPVERFSGDTTGQDKTINMNKGIAKDVNADKKQTYGDVLAAALGLQQKLYAGESIATKEQISIANIVLQVADQLGAKRKIKVVAIMTGIHESRLRNLPYGDLDSLGVFQQRANWGSVQERLDVETSAKLFINMAMKRDAEFGGELDYYDLAYASQFQGDSSPWGKGRWFFDQKIQWREQAERFVTAYGTPGGDNESSSVVANNMRPNASSGGEFFFYRGKITGNSGQKVREPENSWTCIQRLADEVDYRAFFRAGFFYYMSEDAMFKQEPLLTFNEWMPGVRGVSGNFYEKKKAAVLTITVDVGRWSVPPGSVVVVEQMGPWNGRWIVSEYNRDLFDLTATVTLSRRRPQLPEPLQGNAQDVQSWVPKIGAGGRTTTSAGNGSYINPLPTKPSTSSEFNMPDPQGAPDARGNKYHSAKDWFAAGDTPVMAPTSGKIVEAFHTTDFSGQVYGGVVKLQEGTDSPHPGYVWVFRHTNPVPLLTEGTQVKQGDVIGNVATWLDKPTSSHSHIEIWKTLAGGYHHENMLDPLPFMRGEYDVPR